MKKHVLIVLAMLVMIGLFAGISHAQEACRMNEPGSMVTFPLIDNIYHNTIVDIANTCTHDVLLECRMITHGIGNANGDYEIDEKKSFIIPLSPKEKFWWSTNRRYFRPPIPGFDPINIQGFPDRKGYLFCYVIDDVFNQCEAADDCIKAEAVLYKGGRAFSYNAIPTQAVGTVNSDCIIDLDGVEFCAQSGVIMFEGFTEDSFGGMRGTLAVANLDLDFINSIQPEFDINLDCWNEWEIKSDVHLEFVDYEQYDLTDDLQQTYQNVGTYGFHCRSATSTPHPLWAIFYQNIGGLEWGNNVWQCSAPDCLKPTAIILP